MTMTRLLTFALALATVAGCGNSDSCQPNTACSPGSTNHYRFCNGGGADDCYYEMGDHTRYHCATCGDCSDAEGLAGDWCSEQPEKSTTNSSTGLGSICNSAGSCPSGGSYQFCASQSETNCGYATSDGQVFKCNACSDCSAASQAAANWCETGSSTNTTTTTSAADVACRSSASCASCCAQDHPSGVAFYEQLYTECACPYCGSSCVNGCSATTTDGACRSCIDEAAQQQCTSTLSGCSADADCAAFITCTQACPQ